MTPRKTKANTALPELKIPAAYFAKCIDESGYPRIRLAKILGVSPATITRWASGFAEIPIAAARDMALLGWNPIVLCPDIRRAVEVVELYGQQQDQNADNPFAVPTHA